MAENTETIVHEEIPEEILSTADKIKRERTKITKAYEEMVGLNEGIVRLNEEIVRLNEEIVKSYTIIVGLNEEINEETNEK